MVVPKFVKLIQLYQFHKCVVALLLTPLISIFVFDISVGVSKDSPRSTEHTSALEIWCTKIEENLKNLQKKAFMMIIVSSLMSTKSSTACLVNDATCLTPLGAMRARQYFRERIFRLNGLWYKTKNIENY